MTNTDDGKECGCWCLRGHEAVHISEVTNVALDSVGFCTWLVLWHAMLENRVTTIHLSASPIVLLLQPELWDRSQSNFGWLEPGLEAKTFRWWRRSLTFGFRFHRPSLLGTLVLQIMQWFSLLNGPGHYGTGAKNFRCLELEPSAEAWYLSSGSTFQATTCTPGPIALVRQFFEHFCVLPSPVLLIFFHLFFTNSRTLLCAFAD